MMQKTRTRNEIVIWPERRESPQTTVAMTIWRVQPRDLVFIRDTMPPATERKRVTTCPVVASAPFPRPPLRKSWNIMVSIDAKPNLQLDQLLGAGQLPALPQSAIRILELSKDPDNGPAEFAVPIEADAGLTGQVLQFVNSSYFGFSREISSIRLAITLVGIRTIKNFTLWSAVFSLMPNPKCGPLDLKSLWQDSLRRALAARAIGKLLGLKDADEAFAAGLLQDMAIPLLAKELPEAYVELLNGRENGKYRLSDLERERFGWTHADAAARMGQRWNLPDELIQPLARHIESAKVVSDNAAAPGVRAVALSALLPAGVDNCWNECTQFDELYQQIRGTGPTMTEFLAKIDEEFLEFAPVLQMSAPARSLVDCYQDVATATS